MFLSLPADHMQDQFISVLSHLVYKTGIIMTAHRVSYDVYLASTKICNTEVKPIDCVKGTYSWLFTFPALQYVQAVTWDSTQRKQDRCNERNQLCPHRTQLWPENVLTFSNALGSTELSGHLSKAHFLWAYWETSFWYIISSEFWS